jgi:hypothetical protein
MAGPKEKWKEGGVEVACWENDRGQTSYSIGKRYKDKNSGEWKDSTRFFKEDLQKLMKCLTQAIGDMPPPPAAAPDATIDDSSVPF